MSHSAFIKKGDAGDRAAFQWLTHSFCVFQSKADDGSPGQDRSVETEAYGILIKKMRELERIPPPVKMYIKRE